ncbi:MAG: hypothetical protein A3K31_00685 [Ignavibacteria bacterium RIFOXYA12_FULL_35_25]|nr:MAG: hypothetical protein A2X60_16005 [Ignavibacteria bacterium GWF2_35_20]OGU85751.1 MAG: hypothetical protein A3K31_00685 [Ignavibacteria bacterium RIFOXYA12_FULL_35_25]OGV31053.1 MAG: hypothetical protein A2523_05060 [Ignavibacteria bacterium RIFOXYD12_FULL_36_8]
MNILIDIGHPAHVHYFKNFAKEVSSHGNEVLFTCRDKEVTISLLKHYGFRHINFGRNYKSKLGKIFGLFYFTFKLFLVALKFRPDMYLNASMYSAIVAWILRKPHISLEDTFNNEQVNLYLPFTSCVLTGDYPHPSLGKKEIRYNGYQELLYLHPNYFTPDKNVVELLAVNEEEKYMIIRFVAWNASHDFGHKGISYENKIKAITEFEKYAKVFISSESDLPSELQPYQIKIDSHMMHDAIVFASLLFGESSTMAEEAAMLGKPAIYLNDKSTFYTKHLEKRYDLVFNFSESEEDQLKAIDKGIELLKTPNIKEEWQKRRQKMLEDKIDVTAFLVWFMENYPESFRIMKENPGYQYNFK